MRALPLILSAALAVGACAPSPIGSISTPPTTSPSPVRTPSPLPPSVRATPSSAAAAEIEELAARIQQDPSDGVAHRDLGFAYLQRIRETADPSLYPRADAAFEQARRLLPEDPLVLVGIGGLQLSRHEFADALETGQAALAMEPGLRAALAVVADALVELGRYEEAVEVVQELVDLRFDLPALTRVSYLRELHGNHEGALAAMEQAISVAGETGENLAFARTIAATLQAWLGRRDHAAASYEAALTAFPNYAPAIAGLGRLAVAAGDLDRAVERFERAADILPLPEYVIALGEAQEAAGDKEAADRSYALARAQTTLLEAAGVVVDVELALFEADHGDPARALALAEVGYRERPTIRAADTLAWALFRSGRIEEARPLLTEALRLGTRDPLFLYHAGIIEAAAGATEAARSDLEAALAIDAGFSATGAREAREVLADLGGSKPSLGTLGPRRHFSGARTHRITPDLYSSPLIRPRLCHE